MESEEKPLYTPTGRFIPPDGGPNRRPHFYRDENSALWCDTLQEIGIWRGWACDAFYQYVRKRRSPFKLTREQIWDYFHRWLNSTQACEPGLQLRLASLHDRQSPVPWKHEFRAQQDLIKDHREPRRDLFDDIFPMSRASRLFSLLTEQTRVELLTVLIRKGPQFMHDLFLSKCWDRKLPREDQKRPIRQAVASLESKGVVERYNEERTGLQAVRLNWKSPLVSLMEDLEEMRWLDVLHGKMTTLDLPGQEHIDEDLREKKRTLDWLEEVGEKALEMTGRRSKRRVEAMEKVTSLRAFPCRACGAQVTSWMEYKGIEWTGRCECGVLYRAVPTGWMVTRVDIEEDDEE